MKILIVYDAPDLVEVVSLCFEMRWPNSTILTAGTGQDGIRLAQTGQPELIVLDVVLPDMDGFEACREIRYFSDVPIIMLTVRSHDKDIVKGLEWGADDYITKPFSYLQFLARVKAVVRRIQAGPSKESDRPFVSTELSVEFDKREVKVRDLPVKLTNIEHQLLYHLISSAGRPLFIREILTKVWGPEHKETTYLPKVHIQHLRKKSERDPSDPKIIVTERGFGYKFVAPS